MRCRSGFHLLAFAFGELEEKGGGLQTRPGPTHGSLFSKRVFKLSTTDGESRTAVALSTLNDEVEPRRARHNHPPPHENHSPPSIVSSSLFFALKDVDRKPVRFKRIPDAEENMLQDFQGLPHGWCPRNPPVFCMPVSPRQRLTIISSRATVDQQGVDNVPAAAYMRAKYHGDVACTTPLRGTGIPYRTCTAVNASAFLSSISFSYTTAVCAVP